LHWAKGAVAGGFVFLAGTEGIDPETLKPVEDIKAQTRLALEKIKQRLEEMGSSLSNIVKLTYYIAGEFPEGIVASQKYQEMAEARDTFFRENGIDPSDIQSDLIGVTALGRKGMEIEIAAIAVLP
jgi:enamine deaminase RidA (YjgF/YER057c/UK114 family)